MWPALTAVTLYLCVTSQHQLIRESLSGRWEYRPVILLQNDDTELTLDFICAVI